ncbi:hypothetical protein MA16_Dca027668 [Dendrobium catenatum]|uniref:Uncharacterized protein n=1 Tax=Dendrobium catenatum TaxID=906689 RepID=A0A2I0VE27_9ASPA|nr:hypothetical protein MA16_Dca027668 [Dendrobium catenatum]
MQSAARHLATERQTTNGECSRQLVATRRRTTTEVGRFRVEDKVLVSLGHLKNQKVLFFDSDVIGVDRLLVVSFGYQLNGLICVLYM